MSEPNLISNFKKLKTDLAHMTYKEKLEHIWTYYKWTIPVMLVVIMLVSILAASITNLSKVTVMGGISVNVELSDEGKAYLAADYKEYLGLTSKKQSVVLSETYIQNGANATNYTDNYYALMSLMALCANEEVDYLILDEEAFEVMLVQGAFLDLTKVYTQEELEAMGGLVTYFENSESNEVAPIALEITNTAFIQDNANESGKVFFAYVANSPRVEQCKDLYRYLLNWKAAA